MTDLSLEVRLRLFAPDQGGSDEPISDGGRPHWDLRNTWHGGPTYHEGTIFLDGIAELTPGAEGPAILVPLAEEFWAAIEIGAMLPMYEGSHMVGYATVTGMRRAEHFTREVAAFALHARQYCQFVESAAQVPLPERLRRARERLLALYRAACALPQQNPAWDVDAELDSRRPEDWPGFGRYEIYWLIFDPYVEDAPVAGELSDDLLDIYFDVRRGLALWNSPATRAAALWEWRFHFDVHGGAHAVDALSALHRACAG
jgi:hypothetical protein